MRPRVEGVGAISQLGFCPQIGGTYGAPRQSSTLHTVAVGPGGVIHDIPNQMHYDGTGPEGAILEFIAMGRAARN